MSHTILKIGDLDLDLQGHIGLQTSNKIFIVKPLRQTVKH